MQFYRIDLFSPMYFDIKQFNSYRKGHGEINITFRYMNFETLGNQGETDEHKKG